MSLAIEQNVGQDYENHGRLLLTDFAAVGGGVFVPTPPDRPARVDGVIMRDGILTAVVEAKVRSTHDLEFLRTKGNNEYLITATKLNHLAAAASILAVPGFLVVELACLTRLWWRVCGSNGDWEIPFRVEQSSTRHSSVVDHEVVRDNAMLPLVYSHLWH